MNWRSVEWAVEIGGHPVTVAENGPDAWVASIVRDNDRHESEDFAGFASTFDLLERVETWACRHVEAWNADDAGLIQRATQDEGRRRQGLPAFGERL